MPIKRVNERYVRYVMKISRCVCALFPKIIY